MNRMERLHILVVDDQPNVLRAYRRLLGQKHQHHVVCARMASTALSLAQDQLFDIVFVDAKMPYKDAALGGLIVAEELIRLLGRNSVILMSQYDVRDWLATCNLDCAFVPKPEGLTDLEAWLEEELMPEVEEQVRNQYGFMVMPYKNEAHDEWYREKLLPWMQEAGYTMRRMDEIPTKRPINTEMLKRIREANFVAVYIPEKNPNVYFEAGYAMALEKFCMVFAADPELLPFDVRPNHAFRLHGVEDDQLRAQVLDFMSKSRGGIGG